MSFPGQPGNQQGWERQAEAGMPPIPQHAGSPHSPGLAQPYIQPSVSPETRWRPPLAHSPTRKRRRIALAIVASILLLVTVLGGLSLHRLTDFGSAISTQAPFSTQTGFMQGSGRVNLVVLGYGGAGHSGAYLTDSLMVISVVPSTGATTMVSVPRDLWVQVPPSSGRYAKINSAFEYGMNNGYQSMPASMAAGGAEAARKVSEVTGMNVTYWLSIDFTGFRDLVNALGGVDINVPTAFTARYPRNDNPSIDAGWKIIHFHTGPQHFNGEQAIEYARARYVLTPLSEGTDFARSMRQQLLLHSIADRMRQPSAWPGFLNALQALQHTIHTNLSMTDLALFTTRLHLSSAAHIGLSNDNVLQDGQTSDGQYILEPRNGDWGAVQTYVADHLAK